MTVIIDTRANCIAKQCAKTKFQKMLKLSPKDKVPKTWKFRHHPLCAKGATLNHSELELKARTQAEVKFVIGCVWPFSAHRNVLRMGDRDFSHWTCRSFRGK